MRCAFPLYGPISRRAQQGLCPAFGVPCWARRRPAGRSNLELFGAVWRTGLPVETWSKHPQNHICTAVPIRSVFVVRQRLRF